MGEQILFVDRIKAKREGEDESKKGEGNQVSIK